MFSLSIEIR